MTKQVALSNAAYDALRKQKKEGESFSDLCTRLLREANVAKKDPMRFVNFPHKRLISTEEHLRWIEEMREVDSRDAWEEERQRQARAKGDSRSAPQG